jgi:hypothetical protein
MEAIMAIPIRAYFNASCCKCDAVEQEMVAVGAIILCIGCMESTFTTDNPVTKEREKYLSLLNLQKEKYK